MKLTRTKRGQELALSTIIIAVLVLLILLVLGIILTRQTGKFSTGVSSCEARGGTCIEESAYTTCQIKAPQYTCAEVEPAASSKKCCLDAS
ncbi:hypothetical protein HY641_04020 [Candidatus Woesearchaeota archaeon]|nr:hypothetical protein [Candidatus Woesearchaeota archaeon]